MTSQSKRPYSALNELGDWQYPANTDTDPKTFFSCDPNVYFPDIFYDPFSSSVTSGNIFAVPDVIDIDTFKTFLPSPGIAVGPLLAHNTLPLQMSFPFEHSGHVSSPTTHNLLDVGQIPYDSQFAPEPFQSYATHQPPQSATIPQSLQPHSSHQHRKSRSLTPMEVPSINGRSIGSDYVIDSPYEYPHGGDMTPATNQSFEFVERPTEIDHKSGGLLAHENDLMGLEINGKITSFFQCSRSSDARLCLHKASLQTTALDPISEVYSRSPQGIHLEGISPASVAPTFTFNEYSDAWPNANADPWVPGLPLHRPPVPNLASSWVDSFSMLPMTTFNFPQQHEASSSSPSQSHQSPITNPKSRDASIFGEHSHGSIGQMSRDPSHFQELSHGSIGQMSRDPSNIGEHSHRSVSLTHVTSREPTNSPPPITRRTKSRRKAAGRRTGPLEDSKKPGIKMTRKVHACWCCKMRKVTVRIEDLERLVRLLTHTSAMQI